jgi:hypothetical protein
MSALRTNADADQTGSGTAGLSDPSGVLAASCLHALRRGDVRRVDSKVAMSPDFATQA